MNVPYNFKCGFISIVGRPNVGKSTLVNKLVGEKISITSHKPQTTRHRILGITSTENAQCIFFDTPGFQNHHSNALIREMNQGVRSSVEEADVILMLIDAFGWKEDDKKVLSLLSEDKASKTILVINKVDLLKEKDLLLPLMSASSSFFPFQSIVPLSAEKDKSFSVLFKEIITLLPENRPFYDEELYTDRPPRFLAAELIREKAFRLLGDELPYGITVIIDLWEENSKKVNIKASLYVDKEAHKGIVIGANGEKLREISRLARAEISHLLNKQVYLEVWVKVKKNWNNDPQLLKTLGY